MQMYVGDFLKKEGKQQGKKFTFTGFSIENGKSFPAE